ncbi:MAG: domain containing protein [Mucilaginibacter sp.]|nr:domain containing protein [Mucilaginibacter sp.]
MNSELVFSVKNIFSEYLTKTSGSSGHIYNYHIPAYQRGYKWSSDPHGAVTILLNDLEEAYSTFRSQGHKEYYLQYITLKKNEKSRHLEVIDGQQRLTTLSLLISVYSLILDIENLAENKLEYAIRGSFFNDHIYNRENLSELLNTPWDQDKGLMLDEPINNQDVFYIYSAAKRINTFIGAISEDELKAFYEFILNGVKIIVNVVDRHVVSEKVFSNLNSNKVALTEAELIKGLLITRVSREHLQKSSGMTYREMLEFRMVIGRQWDELSRWTAVPEVKSFFFPDTSGIHGLLKLVANSFESPDNKLDQTMTEKDYPMFNFFHKLGNVSETFERIREYAASLHDWFDETSDYNLLGFCFFAKGNSSKRNQLLLKGFKSKKKVFRKYLLREVVRLLPQKAAKDLYYHLDDNDIHHILLAMSVFLKGRTVRFDFHTYIDELWSLEHIFPQSPEGKKKKLNQEDKDRIIEMLGDSATDKIRKVLQKKERTEDQKQLYYEALGKEPFLNSIGNICLLTSEDNASNGCGFFNDKRTNILNLISEGSFVPRHTFEVFSKMVIADDPGNLLHWTKKNIEQHTESIQTRIDEIKDELKNEDREI